MVDSLSDREIGELRRGGHDPVKIYAAFAAATLRNGRPSVVLAKTMKGYGMGPLGQGRMTTHQQKKLESEDLVAFRDRFELPLSDAEAADAEFYRPAPDSAELRYLLERRAALGGYLPERRTTSDPLPVPDVTRVAAFSLNADGKVMSTTTAFVRQLGRSSKIPLWVRGSCRSWPTRHVHSEWRIYSAR